MCINKWWIKKLSLRHLSQSEIRDQLSACFSSPTTRHDEIVSDYVKDVKSKKINGADMVVMS